MSQDLRELFKQDRKLVNETMPEGHEARFLEKLEKHASNETKDLKSNWWRVAASIFLFIGLGFATFKYFEKPADISNNKIVNQEDQSKNEQLKSLGDISPSLKKIENYYLANINLELSNVSINEDNKELFDSYVERLAELNEEYKTLSVELTENGPNELTVSALIDNLKLRLNLLYRLKEKLSELNEDEENDIQA
ncbi:MAG: hypothetical protein AAF688_07860 [Bacteroidota bacterium]